MSALDLRYRFIPPTLLVYRLWALRVFGLPPSDLDGFWFGTLPSELGTGTRFRINCHSVLYHADYDDGPVVYHCSCRWFGRWFAAFACPSVFLLLSPTLPPHPTAFCLTSVCGIATNHRQTCRMNFLPFCIHHLNAAATPHTAALWRFGVGREKKKTEHFAYAFAPGAVLTPSTFHRHSGVKVLRAGLGSSGT